MAGPRIQVDVTSPSDIKSKLGRVRTLIAQTEGNLREQRRALDQLREAEIRLAILAGETPPPARNEASSVQQVVAILEAMGGAATVSEVRGATDPPLKPKTVGWALWQAEADNLIRRVAKGVYAPLSYKVSELALDGGQKE